MGVETEHGLRVRNVIKYVEIRGRVRKSSTARPRMRNNKIFRGRLTVGRLPLEQDILGSNPSPGASQTLGCSLMVGQRVLVPCVRVRLLPPQP